MSLQTPRISMTSRGAFWETFLLPACCRSPAEGAVHVIAETPTSAIPGETF
jgi:hypothetical protein